MWGTPSAVAARGGTLSSLRSRRGRDAGGPSAAAEPRRVAWTLVMCTGERRGGEERLPWAHTGAGSAGTSWRPGCGAGSRRHTELQWITSGAAGAGSALLAGAEVRRDAPAVPKQRL